MRKLIGVTVVLLAACSPEAPVTEAPVENPQSLPAQSPSAQTSPADARTVEDLMSNTIAPGAESLWRAVSYVASEEGVTETAPQSDEDWNRLRDSANALIEAGDELMITEREILTNAFDPATAAFQYSPDEIRQMLAEDPEPWRNYARQLQETTRMTLQAIEFKDVMGLVEFGAQINEACEACHAAYWYRAPETMVPL